MSIFKNETSKEKVNYKVSVSSVKQREKGYSFTLTVNGISIYQMRAYEYKNSNGEEKVSINFPSYKMGEDFVNYVFFPMSHEIREDIVNQIRNLLNNK